MSNQPNDEWMRKSVFDEWKYRHESYGKLMFQWCFAIFAVLTLPLLNPEVMDKIGAAILLFPEIASYIALIAFCHLWSESVNIKILYEAYNESHSKRLSERIAHHDSESFINFLARSATKYMPHIIAGGTIWLSVIEHLILDSALPPNSTRIWNPQIWYCFIPPQENLWVNFGSGRAPSV